VTGATGFIGSQFVKVALKDNASVYTLIRRASNTWRINEVLTQLNVIYGDILDAGQIESQLKEVRPEVCVHFAWYAVPGKYMTSLENVPMISATTNLAKLLSESGCRKFIGIGTCVEYDTRIGLLSENSRTGPTSLYGASKLATFQALSQLSKETGLDVGWARLFYQYGPFEPPMRFVPSLVQRLLKNERVDVRNGDLICDFLFVEDTAKAIWTLARSDLSGSVNVASGQPRALREVAVKIGDIIGCPELISINSAASETEPRSISADISKLKARTAWAPSYTLEEGLGETIRWWRSQNKRD
jgi:nucleoside-diphosphate-sugar epimerase